MQNSKFLYNLKGIYRAVAPSFKRADSVIDDFLSAQDSKGLEYLKSRVDFYFGSDSSFEVKDFSESEIAQIQNERVEYLTRNAVYIPKICTLSQIMNLKVASTYRYDAHEYGRFFPKNFRIYYDFGDVNYFFDRPAITKSRPIDSQNCANSVILKLEKNRHFLFLHDTNTFESKLDKVFFRGGCYQEHRIKFLEKYFKNARCDIGHTGSKSILQEFAKPHASINEHLKYKFLLSLEGNDVASNLKWILSSNSLCIMPKPKYETWFMERNLVADNQNGSGQYAQISDDYSDLEQVLDFYLSNPKVAKAVIANANKYCAQFLDKKRELVLNLLVLKKYFYLSSQCDLSAAQREFFRI